MSKSPSDEPCVPTAYENFLYLLHEMERAVECGQIRWPVGQARIVCDRLTQIARNVGRSSDIEPDDDGPFSDQAPKVQGRGRTRH